MYCIRSLSKLVVYAWLMMHSTCSYSDCNIQAALEKLDAGQISVASQLFDQCLVQSEYRLEVLIPRAVIAREKAQFTQAEDLLHEAIIKRVRVPYGRLELAVTMEWQGKLQSASRIYDAILLEVPENLPARLGQARMQHWMGDLETSIANYNKILVDYPNYLPGVIGLSFARLGNMDLELAKMSFEQVLVLDPDNPEYTNGISMISDIRKNRLEFENGWKSVSEDQTVMQQRVSFSRQSSYRLRWRLESLYRDEFAGAPTISSVPVDRTIRSAISASADIKWNWRTSTLLQYRKEEIEGDRRQEKIQLEAMRVLNDRHRAFLGFIPSYVEGSNVNQLLYGGYIFKPNERQTWMGQIYNSTDTEFANSNALSLSLIQNYGTRNYYQIGVSSSRSDNKEEHSAYGKINHYFNRDWSLSVNFLNNFSTESSEISFGVNYEF